MVIPHACGPSGSRRGVFGWLAQNSDGYQPMPGPGKPFQKGQSGNPGGRPKTKPLTDSLRKELAKKAPGTQLRQGELAVWKLVQMGLAGDMAALKEIFNRIEGTPVQATEVSGPGGTGLEIVIRRVDGRTADAGDGAA